MQVSVQAQESLSSYYLDLLSLSPVQCQQNACFFRFRTRNCDHQKLNTRHHSDIVHQVAGPNLLLILFLDICAIFNSHVYFPAYHNCDKLWRHLVVYKASCLTLGYNFIPYRNEGDELLSRDRRLLCEACIWSHYFPGEVSNFHFEHYSNEYS